MIARPVSGIVFVATLAVVLAGCGSFSAPPKDRFYRLSAAPVTALDPAAPAGEGPLVYVAPFEASGLHAERALVFAYDDGTSLEQHGYHFWIDSPRMLLQQALASTLAAEAGARVSTQATPDAGVVVRGRIERFEQTEDGSGADVALVLAAYEGTRASTPFLERGYARSAQASGKGVGPSVAAIDQATTEILAAFARELAPHLAR